MAALFSNFLFINSSNIFFLFVFLFNLGYFNIIFFNEEFIICISLLLYFFVLFFLLRKIVVLFFFFESEFLYLLFFVIIGLNILYLKNSMTYLCFLYNYSYFLKNNKLFLLFSFFLNKFINILVYFKNRFKNLVTLFTGKINYNYSNFLDILFNINNIFIYNIVNKNIDYIIVKVLCLFNFMYLTFLYNINSSYVS